MTTRTTQRFVTFKQPFALDVIEGLIPAGVYLIETDEESIDAASRLAWRKVATTIHVHANGAVQAVPITSAQLDALLSRDEPAAASA